MLLILEKMEQIFKKKKNQSVISSRKQQYTCVHVLWSTGSVHPIIYSAYLYQQTVNSLWYEFWFDGNKSVKTLLT